MPSRRHGRNAQIYLSATTAGVATPLPFAASWSHQPGRRQRRGHRFRRREQDICRRAPGFSSGDFSGFLDAGTSQTYIAAADGLSRKMYLYWDATNDPNSYWYGLFYLISARTGRSAARSTSNPPGTRPGRSSATRPGAAWAPEPFIPVPIQPYVASAPRRTRPDRIPVDQQLGALRGCSPAGRYEVARPRAAWRVAAHGPRPAPAADHCRGRSRRLPPCASSRARYSSWVTPYSLFAGFRRTSLRSFPRCGPSALC